MSLNRSRLSKKLQKDSQKTFLISVFGIVLVIALLVKFGIPLLINFTTIMSKISGQKDQQTNEDSKGFLAPPILDALPNATNSALFKISGSTSSKNTVSLYINNELVDKRNSDDKGLFSFADIRLSKGENTIKTKTVDGKKESEFSNEVNIIYKDAPPTLTLDNPSDGQKFEKDNKNISIAGKADPGVKVTINDLWAIVNINGEFSYNLPLQNGDNNIRVVATDDAGNKTELQRKVTYSP